MGAKFEIRRIFFLFLSCELSRSLLYDIASALEGKGYYQQRGMQSLKRLLYTIHTMYIYSSIRSWFPSRASGAGLNATKSRVDNLTSLRPILKQEIERPY